MMSNRAIAIKRLTATALPCVIFCVCSGTSVMAADTSSVPASLTASQIVEKNVAARGGLQAWRGVGTLVVTGKMDAGSGDSVARSEKIAREGMGATVKRSRAGDPALADKATADRQVQLPFTLEMKRPGKSRLEIQFAGKMAVQVYDGTNGWKLRPYLNRNDAEPFTAQEAKAAAGKGDMEGPLIDYAAKGTKVDFENVEPVDGHAAYKLKLTMKSGDVQHVWIDAHSFLDVKIEGIPRRMDGRIHSVYVFQRDFRSVQGVMVPFLLETAVDGYPVGHKTVIEKVTLNQKLDDSAFTKPRA
jgi:hypothetical protein